MDIPVTKPGDQVFSSSFIVEFIKAQDICGEVQDEDEYRKALEYEDGHMIMRDLVNAFEMWPRDMARVKREAESLLDYDINSEWVRIPGKYFFTNWVQISDDTISRRPGDRIRRVHVHLKEEMSNIKSIYIFEVKKKQEMKTLQTLAAETISECISKREDFEHLEVPKQLLTELNQSYDDIWRLKKWKKWSRKGWQVVS